MGTIPTKAQVTASNKYHAYTAGWRDACAARPIRFNPDQSPNVKYYMQGYEEGKMASSKMSTAAAKRFKYTPSILRTMPWSP